MFDDFFLVKKRLKTLKKLMLVRAESGLKIRGQDLCLKMENERQASESVSNLPPEKWVVTFHCLKFQREESHSLVGVWPPDL